MGDRVPLHQWEKAKKIEKVTGIALKILVGTGLAVLAGLVLWGICGLISLALPIPWLFWTIVGIVTFLTLTVTVGSLNEHYSDIRLKGEVEGTIDE